RRRVTMNARLAVLGAITTIALGVGVVSTAHALPNPAFLPCQEAIAKGSLKFASGKLKAKQKCINKDLKSPGDCDQAATAAAIAKLQTKLNEAIDKKCPPIGTNGLTQLGFPGKCSDPTPGDAFTVADLKDCMFNSHEDAVDSLLDIEYGTTTGPITDSALLKCQTTI